MTEKKNKLRKELLASRRNIQDKAEKDKKIFSHLLSLDEIQSSGVFFVYASSAIEVGTRSFIEYALGAGKKIALPVCDTEKCEMTFYYINSLDCLHESGYKGILEPSPDKCTKASFDEKTVCIVPALSYDSEGFRLGFGKGYYDRFLACFSGTAIGICYEENLREALPRNRFDKNVSITVTDKEIYKL